MTEFAPQLKLFHYADKLVDFVNKEYHSAPVQVEISPTNSCNAHCDWCFYISSEYKQKHSQEEIDGDVLAAALRDMSDIGVKAITWTGGGDPSTYSIIDDMIDLASEFGLEQGMFTNAYKPIKSPEKLAWIRVTVTEKFTITKHVARYAEATKTGVNFNLCSKNLEQLYPIAAQAREAGVAYFQVRPALSDRADLQQWIRKPEWLKEELETSKFRVVLTDYKWDDYLQPHGYPKCYGHQFVPFLWHNADLAVCAYHFGKPEFTLGNLATDDGFKGVWYGTRRRQMLEDGVGVVHDCQHCCKLHEINKPLAILSGDVAGPEDLAFL